MRFCSLLCACILFSVEKNHAAVIRSTAAGGSWNQTASWVGGKVPGSMDDVVIASGSTISLGAATVAAGILSLKVEPSAQLLMAGANGINFNIQGDIENNGLIDLWLGRSLGATIYLRGNSTWSGTGIWNLSQINVSSFALEFGNDVTLKINRKIDIVQGSGSINKLNRRSGIHFIFASGDSPASLPCHSDDIFYGDITIDKKDRVAVSFTSNGTEEAYVRIQIAGTITVNEGAQITVGNFHVLDVRNVIQGNGRIRGGTSSDIVISGNGPQTRFNTGTGVFRNFTVDRPEGVIIDSTLTVRETLALNNRGKLVLPSGNNFSLVIGSATTAGAITGDGYLVQPPWTLVRELADLTLLGTADIKLRFLPGEGQTTLHDLTITKPEGTVTLEEGTNLWVRNGMKFNRGFLSVGNSHLRLSGPVTASAESGISGSSQSTLYVDNAVSAATVTLYFDQSTPESRTLKSYTQMRNATVTLGNALCIAEELNLSAGVAANVLNSNGNLTLLSTAQRSARVSSLGASSVSGIVHVQRFVSGLQRGYRLISSPVYHSTNAFTIAALKNATLITGPAGGGFDPSPLNNPSVWIYRERDPAPGNQRILDSDYKGLLTLNTPVPVGSGLLFFNRGSRTERPGFNKISGPFPQPEDNILVFSGTLNQGTIAARIPAQTISNYSVESPYAKEGPGASSSSRHYLNSSIASTTQLSCTNWSGTSANPADQYTDGFNLLGNPYASTIDIGSVQFGDDMSRNIYVYNPRNRQFSAYNMLGGVSDGNGASAFIAAGQGFFVQARNAGSRATVTFTENCKVPEQPAPAGTPRLLMGKSGVKTAPEGIVLCFEKDSLTYDSAAIGFDDRASENTDEFDAADQDGIGTTLRFSSFSGDAKRLAVNMLPYVKNRTEISLHTASAATGSFVIRATRFNLQKTDAFLLDHAVKDSVKLDSGTRYTFTSDAGDLENRFSVIFHPRKEAVFTRENPVRTQREAIVYPNPVRNRLGLRLPDEQRRQCGIRVSDMNGKPVLERASVSEQIDVTSLRPGTYIVELFHRNNRKITARSIFIKQ